MDVRQQLHELIDSLSNEQAAELLATWDSDLLEPAPLTPEDVASIMRGVEQARRGEGSSMADFKRRFRLPA